MSTVNNYAAWRATIPWHDDEIVAALYECADHEVNEWMAARRRRWAQHLARTGRLRAAVVACAVPYLVRLCSVCAAPAKWRRGPHGYCDAHQHVVPAGVRVALARLNQRHNAIAERLAERDKQARAADALRQWHKDTKLRERR